MSERSRSRCNGRCGEIFERYLYRLEKSAAMSLRAISSPQRFDIRCRIYLHHDPSLEVNHGAKCSKRARFSII
jgi:hypothetical protein